MRLLEIEPVSLTPVVDFGHPEGDGVTLRARSLPEAIGSYRLIMMALHEIRNSLNLTKAPFVQLPIHSKALAFLGSKIPILPPFPLFQVAINQGNLKKVLFFGIAEDLVELEVSPKRRLALT